MQQQPPLLLLRQRLIDAVDDKYHVIDMAAIVDVLGTLEKLAVTKEVLESTRLGRTVNEFRRRVNNEQLAKRAKDLVKKWRDQVLPEQPYQPSSPFVGRPVNGNAFIVSEGPGQGPGSLSYASNTALSSVNGKSAHPVGTQNEVPDSPPAPSEHFFPHNVPPSSSSTNINGSVIPVWDGPASTQFTSVSSRPPTPGPAFREGSPGSSASLASISPKLASAAFITSTSLGSPSSTNEPTSSLKGRGRKRKRKAVTMEDKLADVTSLLKGQIAKANELRSGIPRVPPPAAVNLLDEHRSSSPDGGYSLSATLSPDDQLIKNDLVEKYLKSQSELMSQMERQYQDRLARNEFQDSVSATEEDAETVSSVNSVLAGDVTDAAASTHSPSSTKDRPKLSAKKGDKSSTRRKKQELKAAALAESDPTTQNSFQFETESEILNKLPPIDPNILAEFADFEYDLSEPVGEILPDPSLIKIETERLNDTTGYSAELNVNAASETINKMFDFGDSDDEDDEDLIEVPIPEDPLFRPREIETVLITATAIEKAEEVHYREVDESEVERLHEEKVENLNGNSDKAGTFREWHETLVVESYGGEDLLVLPYCVIDF